MIHLTTEETAKGWWAAEDWKNFKTPTYCGLPDAGDHDSVKELIRDIRTSGAAEASIWLTKRGGVCPECMKHPEAALAFLALQVY